MKSAKLFCGAVVFVVLMMLIAGDMSSAAVVYPIDGNGAYTANLMRHYSTTGVFTTVEDFTSGNPNGYAGDWWSSYGAIDMAHDPDVWYGNGSHPIPDPNSTAALRWTLDKSYDLKEFVHYYSYPYRQPTSYEILVSNTGFGSMTTVVTSTNINNAKMVDVLATPVNAKYIEYRWTGSQTYGRMDLWEFTAFSGTPITSSDGFALNPLITSITDVTPGKWNGTSYNYLFDGQYDTSGRGIGSGDAAIVVELPTIHNLTKLTLGGDNGYGTWGTAKFEASTDNATWTTIYNGAVNCDFSVNAGLVPAKYIRITNIGGNTANANEIEIYGVEAQSPVPEPATAALVLMGALSLVVRRRT